MSKDKTAVAERLKAKILSENRLFVHKNLAISEQVEVLRKEKGWTQKELAQKLGKTESEVSRLLSGLHNLTLKSITKLEAELGSDIIVTPIEASKKYKSTEYAAFRFYVPTLTPYKERAAEYVEESEVIYQNLHSKVAESAIQPELISMISIKVFKAILTTTDEYLDNPVKPDGIEIRLGQHTALNPENNNVRIRLDIQLEAMKNETELIGLSGEYGFEFQLHVDSLAQFIVEKEGKMVINRKLGGTLSDIIVSTSRGILFERTSSTFFNGVLLPVIDTNLLSGQR